MAVIITADEYLTVNNIVLATPAWRILSLAPLHDDPPVRGEDVIIPGALGVRPYARTIHASVRTFGLVIFGIADDEGEPYDDPLQGLIDNREALSAGLGLADQSSVAGTVTATWTQPDSGTKTGPVTVLGLKGAVKVGPYTLKTTLDLSFPQGALA